MSRTLTGLLLSVLLAASSVSGMNSTIPSDLMSDYPSADSQAVMLQTESQLRDVVASSFGLNGAVCWQQTFTFWKVASLQFAGQIGSSIGHGRLGLDLMGGFGLTIGVPDVFMVSLYSDIVAKISIKLPALMNKALDAALSPTHALLKAVQWGVKRILKGLVKKDKHYLSFQRFMKRFRKTPGTKLRAIRDARYGALYTDKTMIAAVKADAQKRMHECEDVVEKMRTCGHLTYGAYCDLEDALMKKGASTRSRAYGLYRHLSNKATKDCFVSKKQYREKYGELSKSWDNADKWCKERKADAAENTGER